MARLTILTTAIRIAMVAAVIVLAAAHPGAVHPAILHYSVR